MHPGAGLPVGTRLRPTAAPGRASECKGRTTDRGGPPVTETLAYGVTARIGGLGRGDQLIGKAPRHVLTKLRGQGLTQPRGQGLIIRGRGLCGGCRRALDIRRGACNYRMEEPSKDSYQLPLPHAQIYSRAIQP